MTPEQIAADLLEKWNKQTYVLNFARASHKADVLLASIATALREARAQALEEVAVWHDEREKEWERAAKGSERLGLHDFYQADLRRAIEHGLSAKHFRALKHKDGQP